MCCGSCLLLLCKIVDSFFKDQTQKNEDLVRQRASDLCRRYNKEKRKMSDAYLSDDEPIETSDSEDEETEKKIKQE